MRKLLAALILALALLATQAFPALACGGLIAPDGDVRLARAATLVAWHNGIEHYMTSFTFHGEASNIGWIVPLPAVPIKIEAGGAWTLQRLFNESHPAPEQSFSIASGSAGTASSAQVLQQVKVEALNITVIKGTGHEVIDWAYHNGFYLDDETRSHLLVYAQGSPIFMAAKYDTSAAKARHQLEGDGAPVLITMKTPHPWIPLEVLALDGQQVNADLYLLTDTPLNITDLNVKIGQSAVGSEIPGAPGFRLAFQEKLNDQLYSDLSSDRNMSWVWPNSWLTYLSLDAPSSSVTYDLSVSSAGVIRLASFGTPPMSIVANTHSKELPAWLPTLPMGTPGIALTVLGVVLSVGALFWLFGRRRHAKPQAPIEQAS